MKWYTGLHEKNTSGRVGSYRPWVDTDIVLLNTCLWYNDGFYKTGSGMVPLMSPELPSRYSKSVLNRSWTGKRVEYRWGRQKISLELRTTLPGPLFTANGRKIRLRWAFGNAPDFVTNLESGWRKYIGSLGDCDNGRILFCESKVMNSMLIASAPVKNVRAITHEHWEITFSKSNPRLMWVPLIDNADAKLNSRKRRLWLELIKAPPVSCRESYAVSGNTLHLRQTFPGSGLGPLPQLAALLGSRGGLQKIPGGEELISTLIGPYKLVKKNWWQARINLGWRNATLKPRRTVKGRLSPVPGELAFAGDPSWDPGTPMDQLLSLRVWAPLAGIAPEKVWEELVPRLNPPTPREFKKSLVCITDPNSKRKWTKEAKLFDNAGDVSYDADWYNGLSLAGMFAAIKCNDPEISKPAQRLVKKCKTERRLMVNYYELFHDWSLGAAWTDPRGEVWNLDCSHNGLQGMLAEARMRETEGDKTGAHRMLYLAGKSATAFMAAHPLADYCRKIRYVLKDSGNPHHLGIQHLKELKGVGIINPPDKAPYALAGNFPAFCALIKKHGPVRRFRQVSKIWEKKHKWRYRNWLKFYMGSEVDMVFVTGRQEDRGQAVVFYHLAPEIGLRLWILNQNPDSVERLFKTPLNLAEQLWCRCGAKLII
jgi:hypothetical protein